MKKNLFRQMLPVLLLIVTIGIQKAVFGQIKTASVKVNKNVAYQKITGFGGFVNSPQFTYNHMTPAEIQQMWGASSEGGYNIMRMYIPIGEANWAQAIPTAQLAKSLGIKIFASPWSMPAEWKTVNTINSQYDSAGIKKEVYLKPEYYGEYARYLNNFVVLLRNNGVELDAISIQNEPDWKADYAGCIWTPAQMTKFLKENSDSISCPIIAPESIGMSDGFATAFAAPDVLPKFKLYGGHQYGGIGTTFKNLQPQGKELWMSEYLINWNESGTARDFIWSTDAFTFANAVNNALLSNVNAWIHYSAKRFYGLVGDGQYGSTLGVVTKRGKILSQYAKYTTGSTRVQHAFTDNTGSLTGSAYLSVAGDSVVVMVMNPSANAFSLAVDLPFLSASGKTIKTTATEDMTTTSITFTETNRPKVSIGPSSVTTLVFKKSGDFTPSQMTSEILNYKKIESQTPTSAAFGTDYMLSNKTVVFSSSSPLISTNTTASNGYLALDSMYNKLVFRVDTLTSALNYNSGTTTLNYINAAGATKSYNYGTVNFDQRTNFDWVLDISTNVLTDTCKGIISLTNSNFSSILTFKLKNVYFALGTEKGRNFSGTYSPYDGNLLDAFDDTTYTALNFTSATGIPASTDFYGNAANKNAIFYTLAGIVSNKTDVVEGSTNNNLMLSDLGGDFYPPTGFVTNSATYQATISGYKMLTLPFQAGIPTGVKAYTLSFAGSQVNGALITNNIILANTPVLVSGSGSYTFTGSGAIQSLLNPKAGIATAVFIRVKAPLNSYYLATFNGTTSFIKATASVQPLVNPFSAYLSPAATASSLPIVLDDGSVLSAPIITASETVLNNMGYVTPGGASIVRSFTVSGTALTQNLVITAPAGFEVSLSSGSGYAASLSLVPASGIVANTTVYVRVVSGLSANAYSGTLTVTSTGGTPKNVALSGTVAAQALLYATETAIADLGYSTSSNVPPVKSFYVRGNPLIGDITLTAPANFELSRTNSSGFADVVTVLMSNGKVDSTIIYARLKAGLAQNTYSGNIIISSNTATALSIALSGTVTASIVYNFTSDAATTAATTPPAINITAGSGNTATAGVVSYTDATSGTSNRLRAYSGGQRNQTGAMDLNLFPNNATDYTVTWKQSVGTAATDYKVGVLLRGNAPVGTASTGYVQGMMQGYLFLAYTANGTATPHSEFRIYKSTTATSLSTLVNLSVAGLVPTVGQNIWYRATISGTTTVSMKIEYSTDNATWTTGATATDAAATITSGATQLIWGLGTPNYNFYVDDINFALSSSSLPVNLMSFTAKANGADAQLDWRTATETNNKGFDVEHGTDGRNFSKIGFVAGRGSSSTTTTYSFTHTTPANGIHYYRLNQLNLDGSSKYSSVATLNFGGKGDVITLQGNPVRSEAVVNLTANNSRKMSLKVIDANGKLVVQQHWDVAAGLNTMRIDTDVLAPGMYTIQVADANGSYNLKMLKQ